MKILEGSNIELKDLETFVNGFRFNIPAKVVRVSLAKYGFIENQVGEVGISLTEKDLEDHYDYLLEELKIAVKNSRKLSEEQAILKSEHLAFLIQKQKDNSYRVSRLDFVAYKISQN